MGTDTKNVVALIPAHNEEKGIGDAIEALLNQTRKPDRIIVIADNCTDATESVARAMGCEVWVTKNNRHKKAGALNQVLAYLLAPNMLDDDDVILVQDADSFLDPTFIGNGLAKYTEDIGGIGGVFRGRVESPGLWARAVENFQSNEYARYALDIRRQRGHVLVLTGTATLLRVRILREVVAARRDGRLPYGNGQVYDTKVLTEDNELSFALMRLGYKIKSPAGCTLTTETMPTWRQLAQQRLRWKRGALENLVDYGFDRRTAPYWGRQVMAVIGLLVTFTYIATVVYGLIFGLTLHLFWIGVTVLFGLERAVTVRKRGPKWMVLGAMVVVEMAYDVFLQVVQARAFVQAALKSERAW